MLFGSAELEVPPTVLAAPAETSADDFLLAPLTPPSSDQDFQEVAEVDELRKGVDSLAQQLAAALLMLNTLSVSAAAATEAAQSAAAQNVAQAPAPAPAQAPVQAQFAPLNPVPVSAAAEAASEQSNVGKTLYAWAKQHPAETLTGLSGAN